MVARYAEVALPVPLRNLFTYAIPPALSSALEAGSRVVVPFRRKAMIGVVVETHDRAPQVEEIRDVAEVLDALPTLTPQLLELGRWVAGYYLAPVGEVFRAMLPPAVDIRHERLLTLTDAGREFLRELSSLSNRSETQVAELALLQFCEVEGEVRSTRLRRLPGGEAAAERLLRRGCLEAREIARRTKARTQTIVGWPRVQTNAASAEPASPAETRLREVLTALRGPIPLPQLLSEAQVSRSVVQRLVRQGRLETWEEPLASDDFFDADFTPPSNVLNAEQQRAAGEVERWLEAGAFTAGLLHGVTGSGKTEVYLRAIAATLARGRAALVLVPEIALTLWMSRLCRAWFGEGVAILHSGLPDAERAREWWRARAGEARVAVGTRSAVFAPLENLGLVIVDEEQESSYKQEETPRYHARDVAIVRAKHAGAVALLGSATPSLETYHNARTGKYRLLELTTRIENRPLAAVELVDMREEFRQSPGTKPGQALARKTRDAVAQCLARGTQALVLINRRGYSWFVLCRSCGAAVQCENCSISLTYHKRRNRLVCHYCGYSRGVPKACPKCDSEYVYFFGEGAEQVEEQLRAQFAAARIGRLDRDTVRSRREYQRLLGAFAGGQLDVLVGTQMVAKGHDFERVTLVGVVAADLSLALPDFRAAERTFQLLTQVAGRAGRGRLPGEVLVQTYYPEHYAIQCAARQDYAAFSARELHFRRMMHYPPYTALASILVRDRKVENAIRWSRMIAQFLGPRETQGVKVLGPAAAPLARLKREYRFQFLVKAPKRSALTRVLSACLDFCAERKIPETAFWVDVDPVSLM
jgi:primosomal protein N' (replication factor Y)